MHKLYVEPNELSYGQKFLLELIDKRALSNFTRTELNSSIHFTYLFHLGTGNLRFAGRQDIYKMRHVVFPDNWFYKLKEPKPKEIQLPEPVEPYDVQKTVNFIKLKEMYDNHELYTFAKENNFSYITFNHIINGRYGVSSAVINKFKSHFEPYLWFVTEDEFKNLKF